MSHHYKHRILRHVAHEAYQPQRTRELAEALGVDRAHLADFTQTVRDLAHDGQVVLGVNETVALPPLGREVTGEFKRHERGFGFLIPDTLNRHGDLFVSPRDTLDAMTGDRVRAEVVRTNRRGRGGKDGPTARIVEIISRGQSRFVGTADKRGDRWLVFPDGRSLAEPIMIRDAASHRLKPGVKVVVELTRYPENHVLAEGVVTEVLGEAGQPDVETEGVIRAYGLADDFPEEVVNEARNAVRDYNENTEAYFQDRLDLRDTFITTIDPPTAKDFDDAISIEVIKPASERSEDRDRGRGGYAPGARYRLGVHIADVATFVRPDAHLDAEAAQRGNSVYLPRRVLPMLPEVLSNGICSLQPGVPRLAKTVFIDFSDKGRPLAARFANSVIQSAFRLTYLEAQALIDGDRDEAARHAVETNDYTDQLVDAVRAMNQLARSIRGRRFDEGMIVLDLPEVELVFDDDGHVVDAHPEDDAFTHRIIEMFMVEANEAVARALADLDVPAIRRVHPDPDAHGTGDLRKFARVAGYNIPQQPTRRELQDLLDATRGKPEARAVHLAVLKTLTKAEYAPQMIGHFALASEHYLHFTSPIRRYPDLTAHRAIEALLERQGDGVVPRDAGRRKKLGAQLRDDERCPDEGRLFDIARRCSHTEQNAEQAERELRNLLVLQLMTEHLGDEFAGTVTGVTRFGVFIQIDKYLVEGLIRCENLPGAPAERWSVNDATGAMTAQRSGRSLNLGSTVTVRVEAVDLGRREMTLVIIDDPKLRKHKTAPRRDDERRDRPHPAARGKGKKAGPGKGKGRKHKPQRGRRR